MKNKFELLKERGNIRIETSKLFLKISQTQINWLQSLENNKIDEMNAEDKKKALYAISRLKGIEKELNSISSYTC